MRKKIKFIVLLLMITPIGYIGYLYYQFHATYPDKLILKLSPFHDEIEIECSVSSPDLWIIEDVDNSEYEWIIGSPLYCMNNQPQFKHKTDTIIVEGYLKKRLYRIESDDCNKYAVFFDEKVRFLRDK